MGLHIYFVFLAAAVFSTSIASASSSSPKKPYSNSFINPYPRYRAYHDGGDPGEPLFLTPLIKAGKIADARKKAHVVGTQFHGVESYSGYLTVDASHNSNLFFWYFPAESDPIKAPVVLWLQGGPGASSLFGLFTENGPFEFDKEKLVKRNVTWSRNHNLIYIDNPVGTGFSFTDDDAGYSTNQKQVGHNLYEAVTQLFMLFDFSKTSGFWITGESYAGKYVPALAHYTHHAQQTNKEGNIIPLKGMAIGNGLSDPQHQMNYGDYLYQLGLIDLHGHTLFQEAEKKGIDCIHSHDMECAHDVFANLINMHSKSLFYNLSGYETYFNYLKTEPDDSHKVLGEYLQSSLTRRAIHVGNQTFHDLGNKNKVAEHLRKDIMDSVAPWVAELLTNYTVCIYNGQLDIIVAYPMTMNYLQNLKFNHADEYKNATREIWKVGDDIAGYKKTAGNLIEVLVRNAGHMVPMDQPEWMFNLISNITGAGV